jgi:hypothetical protein
MAWQSPMDLWPQPHKNVGRAGVPPRRPWWHRLPACAPHRQDAGATKNFVSAPKLQLGNPIAGKASALRKNHLYYCTICPKQELGNEEKAGCAALSRPASYGHPRPPGGWDRLESLCHLLRPCKVRTAHLNHAQARRLCHHVLDNFSRQLLMGILAHP